MEAWLLRADSLPLDLAPDHERIHGSFNVIWGSFRCGRGGGGCVAVVDVVVVCGKVVATAGVAVTGIVATATDTVVAVAAVAAAARGTTGASGAAYGAATAITIGDYGGDGV